ncbi:MAG: hypothetical protein HOE90_04260 [Bacteriovoracaceae bacterium]|nr:hypothetical protein [Bacteriovoracaceae bacterium]
MKISMINFVLISMLYQTAHASQFDLSFNTKVEGDKKLNLGLKDGHLSYRFQDHTGSGYPTWNWLKLKTEINSKKGLSSWKLNESIVFYRGCFYDIYSSPVPECYGYKIEVDFKNKIESAGLGYYSRYKSIYDNADREFSLQNKQAKATSLNVKRIELSIESYNPDKFSEIIATSSIVLEPTKPVKKEFANDIGSMGFQVCLGKYQAISYDKKDFYPAAQKNRFPKKYSGEKISQYSTITLFKCRYSSDKFTYTLALKTLAGSFNQTHFNLYVRFNPENNTNLFSNKITINEPGNSVSYFSELVEIIKIGKVE